MQLPCREVDAGFSAEKVVEREISERVENGRL
jgi:hypothetical protein